MATIDQGRNAFIAGDLGGAATLLDEVAASKGRFSEPAQLDLAIVELASGNAASASRRLRALRDQFDPRSETHAISGGGSLTADAKALGGKAASMVTDDTARVFQPAGYEEVMIRALLAMCSLVQEDGDAESYINQAALHQSKLRRVAEAKRLKYFPDSLDSTPHQELVLAPYLRGVLREASHHDFDDAQRNYQLVSAIKPDFLPAFDDLNRVTTGSHSRPNHGALYVFALVGRGPVLEPIEAPITSAAVSIASTLIVNESQDEDEVTQLPKVSSVKVPTVVIPPSPIAAVTVTSHALQDGTTAMNTPHPTMNGYRLLGATQSLTDLAELVQRQADAERPWTIARAFTRQAGKQLAVEKARKGLGLDGGIGTAFNFVATNAWTAAEVADTRCWGLLPREIQVLRAELPVGEHNVLLAPVGTDGFAIGPQVTTTQRIDNGRNTYVVIVAPTTNIHLAR